MSKFINGIEIPDQTVVENILERNKDRKNVPSYEIYDRSYSYSELEEQIKTYANAYRKMGIKKGDVVTLCMPGVPEFVISFYALDYLGAVANGVNINFLMNNISTYTDEKKSSTLVIFDKFYEKVKDKIDNTKLENIILTRLEDHMDKKCDDMLDTYKSKDIVLPNKKEIIRMSEFVETGKSNKNDLEMAQYDENRDSTYLYSSGTTGNPKCIVFKDGNITALVNMHKNNMYNEYAGDRSLLIIPPYYATSLLYAINLQLSKGKTLVFQPEYNRYTFYKDLVEKKINHTVAAASHYSAMIGLDLKKDSLKDLKYPICGGEAVPFGLCTQINDILKYCGAPNLMVGGGTSEIGSGVMCSYNLEGRSNETGILFDGVKVKILDPITRQELKTGERGEMIVCAPNSMDRYYNDEEHTKNYFTYDEDGNKWGWPQDIAVKNPNGSYTMIGRKSDSYVNNKGELIYLFDAEEIISNHPDVVECESLALPVNDGKDHKHVIYLVINEANKSRIAEIIESVSKMYPVDGIKVIDKFETSEITGKRNSKVLYNDFNDFYMPNDENTMFKYCFPKTGNITSEIVNKNTINKSEKRFVKKLI